MANPNPELIEELRSMLRNAESGELRAVAAVAISEDSAISTCWVGECATSDLFAATSGMAQDILDEIRSGAHRPEATDDPLFTPTKFIGDN